jgi:hypothetical protein
MQWIGRCFGTPYSRAHKMRLGLSISSGAVQGVVRASKQVRYFAFVALRTEPNRRVLRTGQAHCRPRRGNLYRGVAWFLSMKLVCAVTRLAVCGRVGQCKKDSYEPLGTIGASCKSFGLIGLSFFFSKRLRRHGMRIARRRASFSGVL